MTQFLPLYATFMLISLSGALSPGPLTALSISEGGAGGTLVGQPVGARTRPGGDSTGLRHRLRVGRLAERPCCSGWVRGSRSARGRASCPWLASGESNSRGAPFPARCGRRDLHPGEPLLVALVADPATYVARVMMLSATPLAVGGLAPSHWGADLV